MKKFLFIFPTFLLLAIPVSAASNNINTQASVGSQQGAAQVQQLYVASPSSTGSGVQNQNQVSTQNQGEDIHLQVSTQEQENLGDGEGLQTRSQVVLQNMSVVAQKVQDLLQIRTNNGIGEQVKQIAQNQDQAQTQIQEQINKIDSRNGILKSLLGPDYGAIKNLKQQLEQNQLRIEQLTQLEEQLSNYGDQTTIKEVIQLLTEQNTSLQELINAEEQIKSLFGWLIRLFI